MSPIANRPGLCEAPDVETQSYVFNHTMLRIRDPKVSLDFYSRILGMALVHHLDFPEWKFSLFFLAFRAKDRVFESPFSHPGVLELTHNWGTENNDKTPYHNGNSEPRGFGHICISVPDVKAACARFEKLGVRFQKRLGEGGMKDIAFIKDPDDYWIEVLEPRRM